MSVLVIDKAPGLTSFDVVKRVQRLVAKAWGTSPRSLKVGHGGTLDPLASGVLPVCIGEGTKLAPFLLGADKEYETEVRLGVETDTLDAEGAVVATHPVEGLTSSSAAAALDAFRGEIDQVPPMYSALKRAGKPLYEYARAGETVERAPRRVTIHELELLSFDAPDRARLRLRCSKGTYVRSLVADWGRALGTGAHLTALRRLRSGPFGLADALTLDELVARVEAGGPLPLVSLSAALAHLPVIVVPEAIERRLRFGQRLAWQELGSGVPDSGPSRIEDAAGHLVAVALPTDDGVVRTLRVFHAPAGEMVGGGTEKLGSAVD